MDIFHLQPAVAHEVLAGALALGAAALAGSRWGPQALRIAGTAGAAAAALALVLVAASTLRLAGASRRPAAACQLAPPAPLSPLGVGDPRSVFNRAWGPGEDAPGPRAATPAAPAVPAPAGGRGATVAGGGGAQASGAAPPAGTRSGGVPSAAEVTYRTGPSGPVRVVFSGCPEVARQVAYAAAAGAAGHRGPTALRSLLRRTLPSDATLVVPPFRDAGGATVSLYQSPALAAHLPRSGGYVTAVVTGGSLFVSLGDIENLAPRLPYRMRAM
jgi:hypothetical protein